MTETRVSSDVGYVLSRVRSMPIARRLSLEEQGQVSFGLAFDARFVVRMETATEEQREALVQCRHAMQMTTRALLARVGLLPRTRVEVVPRNQEGWDLEVAELFPVPFPDLLAAAEAFLGEMDQEDAEEAG